MTPDEERGRRIALYLRKSNLREADLAEALGVSLAMISRWERGVTRIPYHRFTQIAALLNMPADAWIVPAQVVGAAS